jgi:peptide/nickel transport system substrate-binding protein
MALNRKVRWKWLFVTTALAVGIAVIAASASSGATQANKTSKGKTFPNFRIAYDTGIDFLDPGLSYTVQGAGIMWNVYLPLIGYKHVNGPGSATLVPYLAKSLPSVTNGGKTYTLVLRKGLKYSNGTPVKASDFRYTIERDYKIDSPGVGFYSNIIGADQFGKTKKGHITGIVANDKTGQITIHLQAVQGDFENILALQFSEIVPTGTPAKDQSLTPIPSTGPYMIQSYKPNKQMIGVRNPQWPNNAKTGIGANVPSGNPDKMTIDIIGDPGVALTRTLNGQDDYDFQQPPPDRLSQLQSKYSGQVKVYIPANTFYYFMNTRLAPFNNLKVRQAVNYAINRQALVRIQGGLARPTENILPPGYPEYTKHSLYPYNLAKAKQLVAQSGTKGASITVWTDNNQTRRAPQAGAYLQDVLKSLGYKVKLKIVAAAVYWTTIGNQSTKSQVGFADWFQDYPHPLDWFDVLLNGERITPTHNNNYANFNSPAVNAKIDALKKAPELSSGVIGQWAALDKQVMAQAPWAPYLNVEYLDTFNKNIDLSCYQYNVVYNFDFSTICHK